jgi:hypothetical protein
LPAIKVKIPEKNELFSASSCAGISSYGKKAAIFILALQVAGKDDAPVSRPFLEAESLEGQGEGPGQLQRFIVKAAPLFQFDLIRQNIQTQKNSRGKSPIPIIALT